MSVVIVTRMGSIVLYIALIFVVIFTLLAPGESSTQRQEGRSVLMARKGPKKKVNCKKQGFQLNPMCMHAKFSRKFVEIEKSMKNIRNNQNLANKIKMLEERDKTEKTRINKLREDYNTFTKKIEDANKAESTLIESITNTVEKLVEKVELLKVEKLNQNHTEAYGLS